MLETCSGPSCVLMAKAHPWRRSCGQQKLGITNFSKLLLVQQSLQGCAHRVSSQLVLTSCAQLLVWQACSTLLDYLI